MQRLRQLEPSWLRSGQTTSLVLSETEKLLVRFLGGGMTAHAGRLGCGAGLKLESSSGERARSMEQRFWRSELWCSWCAKLLELSERLRGCVVRFSGSGDHCWVA